MMYKNSVKLLFSNFSLVWKKLLFNLIVWSVIVGLCFLSAVPVFNVLKANGLFDLIHNLFADFVTHLNLANFFEDVGVIATTFSDIIIANFKNIGFNIVLFLFILFFFGKFINGYSLLTQAEVLYSSMSSNMKVGMLSTLFGNFSKITLFELSKFIVTFPIDLIIAYVIILCFRLFGAGGLVSIFAPFIIMLIAILLISLRISMFCCWMPHIAVKDMPIFNSLKINFKLVLRRLPKIFANSIGVIFSIIVANGFAILFTFGTGLLITIPVTSVLLTTFQMSAFYGCYGMRYYVDNSTIVEPKRMGETERLSRIKYHI